MARLQLDGIKTPDDFYEQFFARVPRSVVPDYGGRNLDALNDDLRDLSEPLTVVWKDSALSREHLGDWFGRCLEVLNQVRERPFPVSLVLQ